LLKIYQNGHATSPTRIYAYTPKGGAKKWLAKFVVKLQVDV